MISQSIESPECWLRRRRGLLSCLIGHSGFLSSADRAPLSSERSCRRLGELLDDPCYPFASLDEHVDPLVLVRTMSIALGMITTTSNSWHPSPVRDIVQSSRRR